jgi:hypothetical protein
LVEEVSILARQVGISITVDLTEYLANKIRVLGSVREARSARSARRQSAMPRRASAYGGVSSEEHVV